MEWVIIIGVVLVVIGYTGRKSGGKKPEASPRTNRNRSSNWSPSTTAGSSSELRFSPSRSTEPARWIPAGEAVTIGPLHINSGLFYLGGVLPGQYHGRCGNCVVDPKSKLAAKGEDRAGASMTYWPSYQAISPIARRTYLDWLAGGREDPDIGIGYVFLFFYGLEHRLFVDKAVSESPMLIAEVNRLLVLYGHNGSFRGYATRFLEAASLAASKDDQRPQLAPDIRSGYEMPMPARTYLGRKLALKAPLDAEDALLWVLSMPDTNLRTPAVRCFDELLTLWPRRFALRHPDGLRVNAPKTRLKFEYRAASGGFTAKLDVTDASGPLPDIAAISAPLTGLRDLLANCTEELAPYSRLLGKNPDAKGTLEAAMLLPSDLNPHFRSGEAAKRFEPMFQGKTVASVAVRHLAEALSIDLTGVDKISASLSNQIGAQLDFLHIGYEPDKRYGASPLRPDGHVVIFKAEGGGQVDAAKPSFQAARAMVDVAALAAGADDKVDAGEVQAITNEIRSVPDLGKVERARLIAYASVLLKDKSQNRFALQKLKALDDSAKRAVAKSATASILADGHASPAEGKFLERLYQTMGLPQDDVYSALHRGAVVIDDPVPVAQEHRSPGMAIPPPPTEAGPAASVQIDQSKLARLKSETTAVSQLLADIFTDDDDLRSPVPPKAAENADVQFPGLEAAHGALLTRLLREQPVERSQFEVWARDLRLLPDGAIEQINDWGFDKFDEPLIDGDDQLSIAPHLHAELTEAEAAQ